MIISKLEIQEIPSNSLKTMRLADSSVYNPGIVVENGILEITPPGFLYPTIIKVEKGFSIVLNASNLKIAPTVHPELLQNLPDGIYRLKYSIKPNTQVFVEYSLMRNSQLINKFQLAVCRLFSERISLTRKEFESKRNQLSWIRDLIDASKYKVEEAYEDQEGINLYNEANRLLDKEYERCN